MKLKYKTGLKISALLLFLTLVLYIITFPSFDLTYGDGIDPPLTWVFNFLFKYDFTHTQMVLFPHGPLAFLTYPLAENLNLFFFIDFIIKLILVSFLYIINRKIHRSSNWFVLFVFSYVAFLLSNITQIVILDIILAFIIAHQTRKNVYKYVGFCLIAFSFYIKSYSCSISLIIGASYIIYNLIKSKNRKQFTIDVSILTGLISGLWLFFYHSFSGLGTYCIGIINLVQDNSSAAALYPVNNWALLILSFVIILFVTFFKQNENTFFYRCMFLLVVFAGFKHGMAREDSPHVWGLWVFLLLNFFLFLFYTRKNIILNSILLVLSLGIIYLNFSYKGNYYEQPNYIFLSINNFINFVSNSEDIILKSKQETDNTIQYRKVSEKLAKRIGNSTVDIYPWDYSIVAANCFNWHPRPVIQSYAVYTHWLDSQNSEYFKSKNAPEFLIWDFTKGLNPNIDESDLSSIDGRYLLNDEPNTILSILSNYEFIDSENKLNIYKKRKAIVSYSLKCTPTINTKIDTWISVQPIENHTILRVKIEFTKSVLQRLKSFFYKDEEYWIYIKLSDSSIQKYRIVPKNAEDGLWINPYVFQPAMHRALCVNEIMFKVSNKSILCDDISIKFESIDFNYKDSKKMISEFFPIIEPKINSFCYNYYSRLISFDSEIDSIGLSFEKQKCLNTDGINKSKSFCLYPESFSPTFELKLDTISNIEIKSACWVKSNGANFNNKISYVFAIDDAKGNSISWNALNISDQVLNANDWNLCTHYMKNLDCKGASKLKVFLWNTSRDTIYLDDFHLKVNKIDFK